MSSFRRPKEGAANGRSAERAGDRKQEAIGDSLVEKAEFALRDSGGRYEAANLVPLVQRCCLIEAEVDRILRCLFDAALFRTFGVYEATGFPMVWKKDSEMCSISLSNCHDGCLYN